MELFELGEIIIENGKPNYRETVARHFQNIVSDVANDTETRFMATEFLKRAEFLDNYAKMLELSGGVNGMKAVYDNLIESYADNVDTIPWDDMLKELRLLFERSDLEDRNTKLWTIWMSAEA